MTAPKTALSAQLVIAYDGSTLKVEAAGANGARDKIAGVLFDELPFEIRTALIDQLDRLRAKARADLMALQGQNIQYVAQNHNVALAQKIWGNDKALSRVQRARLQYSSPNAGNLDASGKLKSEKRPAKKTNTAESLEL
jgi:hypothetical protein